MSRKNASLRACVQDVYRLDAVRAQVECYSPGIDSVCACSGERYTKLNG